MPNENQYEEFRKQEEFRKETHEIIHGNDPKYDPNETLAERNSRRNDSPPLEWGLPGEKTAIANSIVKVGWVGVIAGALLWVLHMAMPAMMGAIVPGIVIGVGAFCLVLVYLFQAVGMVLFLAAAVIIWYTGTTPDGFKFSAIPIWAYLAGFGLVAFAYLLKKLLSRD